MDEVGFQFGRIAGHGDGAGGDGVDANFGGKLFGEDAGHQDNAGLGDGMRKVFAPAGEAADVSKIDDDATAGLREIGRGGLGTEERGFEVGVEGGIPGGFRGLTEFSG